MNAIEVIISLVGCFALGYTVGMVHWIVMDCKRQDKLEAEWQARRAADLVHELIEGSKK